MWSLVDTIAVVLVLFGTAIGLRRRLSGELAHVISMIVAVAVGFSVRRPLGEWLLENSRLSPAAAQVLALIGLIVLAALAMAAVRIVLRKAMRVVFEEHVDIIGGAVAGFVRAALFIAVVFLVMNMIPHEGLNRIFGETSFWGRIVNRYTPVLEEKIEEVAAEIGHE